MREDQGGLHDQGGNDIFILRQSHSTYRFGAVVCTHASHLPFHASNLSEADPFQLPRGSGEETWVWTTLNIETLERLVFCGRIVCPMTLEPA